jgi:hypothetical protein
MHVNGEAKAGRLFWGVALLALLSACSRTASSSDADTGDGTGTGTDGSEPGGGGSISSSDTGERSG